MFSLDGLEGLGFHPTLQNFGATTGGGLPMGEVHIRVI